MNSDCHLHTSFSADSDASMRSMVEAGIKAGLETMCFTEHMDFGYVAEGRLFEVDTPAYLETFSALKKEYAPQVNLLFGVELGLEPQFTDKYQSYLSSYSFDFVIGSAHTAYGADPYYPAFYEGRSEKEAYRSYFEFEAEVLKVFSDFDSFGHLDYVVRYGPNRNSFYSYRAYADVLDTILKLLVEKGIGLELNTGGLKYGLGHPNPQEDILCRYRELGGEIITLGSDAHKPEHIAYDFKTARQILTDCGFKYYAVFEKRKPTFFPII